MPMLARFSILSFFTHPRLVFFLLPWLMVLLVAGTLVQRDLGLYEAERRFFASWLIWAGPLPLPGMYPALLLLSAGLLAKLVFKSPWRPAQSGILITHLGVLLLLLGGLLSALSAEEGFLPLSPGETRAVVTDYHARELAVMKNGAPVLRMGHHALEAGLRLREASLPFTLEVAQYCRNCQPQYRENTANDTPGDTPLHGLAAQLVLTPAALEKEDEANLAGAILRIGDTPDAAQDGLYLVFEGMPRYPELRIGGDRYRILLRKQPRALPFSVRLDAFDKQVHPGTATASEYQSLVTIDEGDGMVWQRLIRMNEPLRVQGYTLYQSSFVQRADGETESVLAVVKNHGRVFPYIASLVIGAGLLTHVLLRSRKRRSDV